MPRAILVVHGILIWRMGALSKLNAPIAIVRMTRACEYRVGGDYAGTDLPAARCATVITRRATGDQRFWG
jgi:hypothetical protein